MRKTTKTYAVDAKLSGRPAKFSENFNAASKSDARRKASAGTFSAQSAGAATYVPNTAGTVIVTATSLTDGMTSASATIGAAVVG